MKFPESDKRIYRIAIVGADGSGKTSVCNKLKNELKHAKVIHVVKNRKHFLKTTKYIFNLWQKMESLGYLSNIIGKYILFYPFEYIENLKRLSYKNENIFYLIYDRHPIDRVMMKYEAVFQLRQGLITLRKFLVEYPFLIFWNFIYSKFFLKIDRIYLLTPPPESCMFRSNGHYRNIEAAICKITAYKKAIKDFGYDELFLEISIDNLMGIDDIAKIIINDFNNYIGK